MVSNFKYVKLPFYRNDVEWFINPWTGSLKYREPNKNHETRLPRKVAEALATCDNPFLSRNDPRNLISSATDISAYNKLERMYKILKFLSNKRFYLSRMYASIQEHIFPDTSAAFRAIATLPISEDEQERSCLQRSLLAAKTSKSFGENGVLFIGSSLPRAIMHAWIVENGTQPDAEDRKWILYRPLIAFYF